MPLKRSVGNRGLVGSNLRPPHSRAMLGPIRIPAFDEGREVVGKTVNRAREAFDLVLGETVEKDLPIRLNGLERLFVDFAARRRDADIETAPV